MTEIFKSYDVRGIYPSELNEETAEKIGRALVTTLGAHRVVVGEDHRLSSPSLRAALVKGITAQGADVVLLGQVSTPMFYYGAAKLGVNAGVMITASHNPPEYNGFKICRENAIALGMGSGLEKIRNIIHENVFPKSVRTGTITEKNIRLAFDDLVVAYANFADKRFRVAIDAAHAMGALELPVFYAIPSITITASLYGTLMPPGYCPHEANPMLPETLSELQHVVRESRADLGIAYDGDADRLGFVDERGHIVPMDLVTALLAREILALYPGATILYDVRSSRAVKEVIEEAGGVAIESRVGHSHIKNQMRETNAIFAGEGSGHYCFALEGYAAEMGTLAAIMLMNHMARTGKTLSELVRSVERYAHSGEMNFRVTNAPEIIERAKKAYSDGHLSTLDGVKVNYPDWWFLLRMSNTEPLLRLNLEANTEELLEQKKRELVQLITG